MNRSSDNENKNQEVILTSNETFKQQINNVISVIVYDCFPTFNKFFNSSGVEIILFDSKKSSN